YDGSGDAGNEQSGPERYQTGDRLAVGRVSEPAGERQSGAVADSGDERFDGREYFGESGSGKSAGSGYSRGADRLAGSSGCGAGRDLFRGSGNGGNAADHGEHERPISSEDFRELDRLAGQPAHAAGVVRAGFVAGERDAFDGFAGERD